MPRRHRVAAADRSAKVYLDLRLSVGVGLLLVPVQCGCSNSRRWSLLLLLMWTPVNLSSVSAFASVRPSWMHGLADHRSRKRIHSFPYCRTSKSSACHAGFFSIQYSLHHRQQQLLIAQGLYCIRPGRRQLAMLSVFLYLAVHLASLTTVLSATRKTPDADDRSPGGRVVARSVSL